MMRASIKYTVPINHEICIKAIKAKKAGNYRETEEVEKNEAKQCCGR